MPIGWKGNQDVLFIDLTAERWSVLPANTGFLRGPWTTKGCPCLGQGLCGELLNGRMEVFVGVTLSGT